MDERTMKEKILQIFAEKLPQVDPEASDTLVDDGYLDSLSLATLVYELSEAFGVIFDMEDFLPDDFNSIDSIARTVKALQG